MSISCEKKELRQTEENSSAKCNIIGKMQNYTKLICGHSFVTTLEQIRIIDFRCGIKFCDPELCEMSSEFVGI